MRHKVELQLLATSTGEMPGPHAPGNDDSFWTGFGLPGCPPLAGKTVLEIGCGRGTRSFQMASHGADLVVGLDPAQESIRVAQRRLRAQPRAVSQRVRFVHGRIADLPVEPAYDIVVSEDALEHVVEVPALLHDVKLRMRHGGRMYVGFGPLYHAPNGDHSWLRATLPGYRFFPWPWGHLMFEDFALRKLSKLHGRPIMGTTDWPYLDLNRHTIEQYEAMFRDSGMKLVALRRNQVRSLRGQLFVLLGRAPRIGRYFTLDVHAVLERTAEASGFAEPRRPELRAMGA